MAKRTERVIFRREYDPYMEMWKYLAVFPDDLSDSGRIGAIPFYRKNFSAMEWWFEPYGEVAFPYYYGTKIIHKNDPVVHELLKAVEDYFEYKPGEFKVCEKLRPEDWYKN